MDVETNTPAPESSGRTIAEVYSSDAANTIRAAILDLRREGIFAKADEVVNAPEPESTRNFLGWVRDHYSLGEDRDEAVRRALDDEVAESWHDTGADWFADALASFAVVTGLQNSDGDSLGDLARDGRDEEVGRLLVKRVYATLADRGGRMEVPA